MRLNPKYKLKDKSKRRGKFSGSLRSIRSQCLSEYHATTSDLDDEVCIPSLRAVGMHITDRP